MTPLASLYIERSTATGWVETMSVPKERRSSVPESH
jgi:hypothetical protein